MLLNCVGSTKHVSFLYQSISLTLLAFYHIYRSLIGYTTQYVFCLRMRVARQCAVNCEQNYTL